jgi:acetyl esterase/lipase
MRKIFFSALALAAAPALFGQQTARDFAAVTQRTYRVVPNITYQIANNWEAKLDVYTPRDAQGPVPTMIYIHGGGWVGGSKESVVLQLLPYMELGMAVVNVEYRLGPVSLAPAAVIDCRCALRWVYSHASEYGFDLKKLVVSGGSAGGHLSLTTGMLDPSWGFDNECREGRPDMKLPVAAIVNFYGITDVADLLEGPNQKPYAVRWLSHMPDRKEIARRVSPMQYVRPGLPPILTIHGDADPTVPYAHATMLHKALDAKKVPNELMTIPGGKHGNFTPDEYRQINKRIVEFLTKHKIL